MAVESSEDSQFDQTKFEKKIFTFVRIKTNGFKAVGVRCLIAIKNKKNNIWNSQECDWIYIDFDVNQFKFMSGELPVQVFIPDVKPTDYLVFQFERNFDLLISKIVEMIRNCSVVGSTPNYEWFNQICNYPDVESHYLGSIGIWEKVRDAVQLQLSPGLIQKIENCSKCEATK